MRVYLKGEYRAALKALRQGDCEELERILAENEAAITAIFDGLISGRYDYAFTRKGSIVYLYTRSVKAEGVQKTSFWYQDGELTAISDCQCRNAKSCIDDGYSACCYMNIKVA